VYTALRGEGKQPYRRLYRLYVLKRKSNLSCHLSLFGKILDEFSPVEAFLSTLSRGRAQSALPSVFFHDIPAATTSRTPSEIPIFD